MGYALCLGRECWLNPVSQEGPLEDFTAPRFHLELALFVIVFNGLLFRAVLGIQKIE